MKGTRRLWRVEVRWEDSTVMHGGWRNIEEVLERRDTVTCLSVGFVLADDKRGIVVAGSVHGNEACGIVVIPRSAIRKRKRLR